MKIVIKKNHSNALHIHVFSIIMHTCTYKIFHYSLLRRNERFNSRVMKFISDQKLNLPETF